MAAEHVVTRIVIERVIAEDGADRIGLEYSEDAGVVELLGMLTLAHDSVIREKMGDLTEGDD